MRGRIWVLWWLTWTFNCSLDRVISSQLNSRTISLFLPYEILLKLVTFMPFSINFWNIPLRLEEKRKLTKICLSTNLKESLKHKYFFFKLNQNRWKRVEKRKTVFRPAFRCVQHPKLVEIHNICKYVIVCKQESWQKANAFKKVNKTNF